MIQPLIEKYKTLHVQYKKYFPAAFFAAGFIFDIVTLSRIDDPISLTQQGVYLIIIFFFLRRMAMFESGIWVPTGRFATIWTFHNDILHFLLGSLISIYTIFFFLSASISTSFIFLNIMVALLILNEIPQFQKMGFIFKYSLFLLSLFSFLSILMPMAFGYIGAGPLSVALVLIGGIALLTHYDFSKIANLKMNLRNEIAIPSASIILLIAVLYFFKILPPIPLSIQYMGIYHDIEKVRTHGNLGSVQFHLKYDRPFWKFWQSGAQSFTAYNGDRLYCFVRIFSPTNFNDKVVFHWLKKEDSGWVSQDRVTNNIAGGRIEGFRSFAFKTNYTPGDWRVEIETLDGREIGRIHFSVEKNGLQPPEDRNFKIDIN
jgi:hypothetical protein